MHPTKRNKSFTKKVGFPVILAVKQNRDKRKQMIDIVIKIVFMVYRGLIVCFIFVSNRFTSLSWASRDSVIKTW